MPFIRGRYHINPIMGAAFEAAREAEAARRGGLGLEQEPGYGSDQANDQADGFASTQPGDHAASVPIHRIEIEAAEMVPSHSGRAERGFVARVHRASVPAAVAAQHAAPRADSRPHSGHLSAPETHVFSDHRDLLNFLHDELAKNQPR